MVKKLSLPGVNQSISLILKLPATAVFQKMKILNNLFLVTTVLVI